MANCLCGSWRRTSFGLVCRQCGKHKQVKKRTEKSSQKSFDAILHQIQSEYDNISEDPKDHHQTLSYEIVNGEIIVKAIVYDEDKAKEGKFPKSRTTWKY